MTMTTTSPRRTPVRAPRKTPTATAIQQQAIVLVLTIHAPGNYRRVDANVLKTKADPALLRVTKQLLDADEHKAIAALDRDMKAWLYSRALPSPFKDGTYTIPLALYAEIERKLNEYEAERRKLVTVLRKALPTAKAAAKERLTEELFREKDYPSEKTLQDAYAVEWNYVQFGAPEQLAELDTGLYKREQEKLRRQWEDAIQDMRDALRVGMGEMVNDLVGRLTPDRDGDVKKFRPTALLNRFQDFLQTFDARNLTNDVALSELVERARGLLQGVTTERLKEAPEVRDAIRRGFAEVRSELKTLGVDLQPRRAIVLLDD